MLPEKLKKIVILLKDKTDLRKTLWNKTSANDQFKLLMADGSSIVIWRYHSDHDQLQLMLTVFNSNGDAIERYDTEVEEFNKEDWDLLMTFHKSVSDSYYKVEETMDALIQQISSQDVIGISENGGSVPDDDDLPF